MAPGWSSMNNTNGTLPWKCSEETDIIDLKRSEDYSSTSMMLATLQGWVASPLLEHSFHPTKSALRSDQDKHE